MPRVPAAPSAGASAAAWVTVDCEVWMAIAPSVPAAFTVTWSTTEPLLRLRPLSFAELAPAVIVIVRSCTVAWSAVR